MSKSQKNIFLTASHCDFIVSKISGDRFMDRR